MCKGVKSKFHEQFELKLVIPSVEIYEIQSNNRYDVVETKLHDAMKLCNEGEIKLDVELLDDSWLKIHHLVLIN